MYAILHLFTIFCQTETVMRMRAFISERVYMLHISNDVFSLADIRDIISFLCTSSVYSFGVFLAFCVFVCTSCTIL